MAGVRIPSILLAAALVAGCGSGQKTDDDPSDPGPEEPSEAAPDTSAVPIEDREPAMEVTVTEQAILLDGTEVARMDGAAVPTAEAKEPLAEALAGAFEARLAAETEAWQQTVRQDGHFCDGVTSVSIAPTVRLGWLSPLLYEIRNRPNCDLVFVRETAPRVLSASPWKDMPDQLLPRGPLSSSAVEPVVAILEGGFALSGSRPLPIAGAPEVVTWSRWHMIYGMQEPAPDLPVSADGSYPFEDLASEALQVRSAFPDDPVVFIAAPETAAWGTIAQTYEAWCSAGDSGGKPPACPRLMLWTTEWAETPYYTATEISSLLADREALAKASSKAGRWRKTPEDLRRTHAEEQATQEAYGGHIDSAVAEITAFKQSDGGFPPYSVAERKLGAILGCYQDHLGTLSVETLNADPHQKGQVELAWTVVTDGQTEGATVVSNTVGTDPRFEDCLKQRLVRWKLEPRDDPRELEMTVLFEMGEAPPARKVD